MVHLSRHLLNIFSHKVPEKFGERGLRPLILPLLLHVAASFRGRWAPPSKVAHAVRAVLPLLFAVRRVRCLGARTRRRVTVTLRLKSPPGPQRERAFARAFSLQRRGEDFDRSAFTAGRLAPAEVLHGVGAPLGAVAAVFGGQAALHETERVISIVYADGVGALLLHHRHTHLNAFQYAMLVAQVAAHRAVPTL